MAIFVQSEVECCVCGKKFLSAFPQMVFVIKGAEWHTGKYCEISISLCNDCREYKKLKYPRVIGGYCQMSSHYKKDGTHKEWR